MPRWRWRELLDAWLNAETYREERRFLEDHRELLDSTTIVLLRRRAKKSHASPVNREHAALLDDALRRGGDRAAIREAYIHMYGGLADDVPAWLEELEAHLRDSGKDRRRDQTAGERVALLRPACLRAQQDTGVSPEAGAELSMHLWDALDDLPSGHHGAIDEQEKVTCLVRALRAYSIERYPRQYGIAQNALGQTYVERRDDSSRRGLYIELAIAHCQAALLACPQTQYPDEWAVAQMILGQAYRERPHGNQRDNLERAIKHYSACLEIWQRAGTPTQNALVLNGLGNAYASRIAGNRRDNVENSIAYYEQALTIYTRDDFPSRARPNV
jgi:tetratricopeptide (TPR) repeat protein